MYRQLEGRPFELIVHQLQAYDASLWESLGLFLHGLYAHVGLPADKTEAVLFLRNHVATSFGVHQDDASVFMFILDGRKRILAWPDETFRGAEGAFASLDYERYRDIAMVLEGEVGDVLYWPSHLWHVGEAAADMSASISLGLRLRHSPLADVIKVAAALFARNTGRSSRIDTYPCDCGDPARSAEALPGPLEQGLRRLKELIEGGELEHALRTHWLNRVTGAGFTRAPLPRPAGAISEQSIVSGREEFPVAYLAWRSGYLLVSAGGSTFPVAESPGVIGLLDTLASGRSLPAGRLVEECAAQDVVADPSYLRHVLGELMSRGAVAVRNPTTAAAPEQAAAPAPGA
jgi:hypothetical protein